ncbi:Uma2 family endonuclease [Amycolatopsis nigrescens]|uniref:Uma2 family endonuclease n=1 Tax=Amycolatopsis nigrescens TaxID=381445 RepID=UPI0003615811|nr:Uma2 family endonuclease [Amycolatopsis nigrescens]
MAVPTDVGPLVPRHHGEWTVEDVLGLPEDSSSRIELVDGALLVTPAPASGHQRLLQRLQLRLHPAIPAGAELLPGVNVRLGGRRMLIPDFVVLGSAGAETVYYDGADLLLAGEIESPSTRIQDRVLKRALYAEAGVPYYLLVDPAQVPEAVLYHLSGGEYTELARSADGRLELSVPFAVDLDLTS